MTAVQDIALTKIDGAPAKLGDYKGKVLLVVNVASKCGLTPQYEGLEKLYEEKRALGLEVLGFPANNFGAQEPGSNAEIQTFCQTQYNVQFPMFSKISVKGEDQHPLYKTLTQAQPSATGAGPMIERFKAAGRAPADETEVLWNFEKFLISRRGEVVARFAPSVAPNDQALLHSIDAELAKPA